ncbi:hypothetical protein Cni_G01378 [Canna indica]|uniref:Uncharacterized protein n=1 Tax=Canna indica TaxID=4628 RepID=A0AAQ3JP72_9LILI|nr:hypothetical protein Cni_G01378 [Canna indica]
MCFVCGAEEKVLGSEKAPGNCPYCGGAVVATDVESSWTLCCLPLCRTIKRKLFAENSASIFVLNDEALVSSTWTIPKSRSTTCPSLFTNRITTVICSLSAISRASSTKIENNESPSS